MIGFTEAVSLSASLPVISTHVSPSIIHCLSFPLQQPLVLYVTWACVAGRQRGEEIGSRPRHGRADQLIKPSFGGARQKVKARVILPASFANLCFSYKSPQHTKPGSKNQRGKVLVWSNTSPSRLLSSVRSNAKRQRGKTEHSWKTAVANLHKWKWLIRVSLFCKEPHKKTKQTI